MCNFHLRAHVDILNYQYHRHGFSASRVLLLANPSMMCHHSHVLAQLGLVAAHASHGTARARALAGILGNEKYMTARALVGTKGTCLKERAPWRQPTEPKGNSQATTRLKTAGTLQRRSKPAGTACHSGPANDIAVGGGKKTEA